MSKILRYLKLYGPIRLLYKAAGRKRGIGSVMLSLLTLIRPLKNSGILVIGCGQYSYSTIGYVLNIVARQRIFACYDTDPVNAASFARAYRCLNLAKLDWAALQRINVVYVASSHSSHAGYAVEALDRGKAVYVEKPIATNLADLERLERSARNSAGPIFFGYNRPFSEPVRRFRDHLQKRYAEDGFVQVSFTGAVAGHSLDGGHWYRRPEEGTRISGNVGHWIDLFVHLLAVKGPQHHLQVSITYCAMGASDENLVIAMASDSGDVCAIHFSARGEPLEGVQEQLTLQSGSTICTIDDFRAYRLSFEKSAVDRRFRSKNPGHALALSQPFVKQPMRDAGEVFASARLILHLAEMTKDKQSSGQFLLEIGLWRP